jgi:sugar phosphate permease
VQKFLLDNARWLTAGFLLLFASSFGQTFFISLSGGWVRKEFGLSNGEYASLYMGATLAGALTLVRLGTIVDRIRACRVIALIVPVLALGAIGFAFSFNMPMLFASLFVLRLFGQGMMVHTAYTTLGRWYSAERGRSPFQLSG